MKGLSNEVPHKNAVFYVQTQDMGPSSAYVESLIYKAGLLLASRKSYYFSHLQSPDLPERVLQLMKELHKSIIRDIEAGRLDDALDSSGEEGGGG